MEIVEARFSMKSGDSFTIMVDKIRVQTGRDGKVTAIEWEAPTEQPKPLYIDLAEVAAVVTRTVSS